MYGGRAIYLILYSTAASKVLYIIVSQWWKGNLSHLILNFCSQCALLENNYSVPVQKKADMSLLHGHVNTLLPATSAIGELVLYIIHTIFCNG
jgi:hypothetical protein